MLKINVITLIILCYSLQYGLGQVFDRNPYPPSVKWRQIDSENFRIIYPGPFEEGAQRLMNRLEALRIPVSKTMGKAPRKISIILQNQTVESNGNVQLAPRRSEFYTTPPQRGDYQEWMSNLATHELRHVVQFDKLTGYLRAPFFEQLGLAAYGITLPSWFFEGDAVVTETDLSLAGRGRIPSWEMPFRANLLSGKMYSYQKDYMGSFKDITPGFYELGYFLTSRLQHTYGDAILDSLMTRMAGLPVRPYNFSNSLKKFTGYSTKAWHKKVRADLHSQWFDQLNEIRPTDYPMIPVRTSDKPESWLFPQHLPDGRLLALHQSAYDVPAIVVIDSLGNQETLVKTGRQTEPNFSYADNLLAWDEIRRDPRYAKRSYNVINLYDLSTHSYRQLTHKTRYFSPALRPHHGQLVAVAVDETGTVSLDLLDTETGSLIARFPSPGNTQLQTPAFDGSGNKVIATAVSSSGAAIVELDVATGVYRSLLEGQLQQLERPQYADSRVIFKAHYNGIDNIYALDTAAQTLSQLTNARYGAFHPWFDRAAGQIWFNLYEAEGYRISHLPSNTPSLTYFKTPTIDDRSETYVDSCTPQSWPSKPYNKLKNLINFHSLSVDPGNFDDLGSINPGLYWLSDDLLNTTQVRLGYSYNSDTRGSEFLASVAYQQLFPRLSLDYRNLAQVGTARIADAGSEPPVGLRWREHITTLRMEIPLTFQLLNHVFSTGVSAATSYTQRYRLNEPRFNDRFIDRIRFPLHYHLYFNHAVRQSTLDLAPRWGQYLSLTYRHLPFTDRVAGEHLALRTAFYFPGLARNHSLLVRFNIQQHNGSFALANDIPLVSGYDQLKPLPVDNTLLFNYRFPIAYPDWAIGPLAYIKRFKGGLFADFQNVDAGSSFQPRTFGIEVRSDMNLLRFYLPNFDIGAKLVFTTEGGAPRRIFVTYGIGYSY